MFTFVAVVVAVLFFLYRYFKNRNDFFKRLGLPGPEPKLILGNLAELFTEPPPLILQKWAKNYGKTFGYMEGATPIIVTSDLDILQDVFVKKFQNFHARKMFPLLPNPDTSETINVFLARGLRWKRLRNIANPTFSVAKLKQLVPAIANCCEVLMERLDKKAQEGNSFNIHKYFQEHTIDVIGRVAFGETETAQGNPDNRYLELSKNILHSTTGANNLFFIIAMTLPEVNPLTRFVKKMVEKVKTKPNSGAELYKIVQKVLDNRREASKTFIDDSDKPKDFIQLFLDAEAEEDITSETFIADRTTLDMKALKVSKKMTPGEIHANCLVFLIAGFDTTANTLGFVTWLLATNSQVQNKLMEEIDELIHSDSDISYETVQKLKYLDAVTKEGLRLYPIAAFVEARLCMAGCTVGGVHIPEGCCVAANVMDIQTSTEIWGDDAKIFRPERFLQDETTRHNLSWMPFGAGPRTCIGMRLALLEEKMTICYLLKHFKIVATLKTERPVKIINSGSAFQPESVTVVLEGRE